MLSGGTKLLTWLLVNLSCSVAILRLIFHKMSLITIFEIPLPHLEHIHCSTKEFNQFGTLIYHNEMFLPLLTIKIYKLQDKSFCHHSRSVYPEMSSYYILDKEASNRK